MKVNAHLTRTLREAKSWTQADMALAAGLNLRTVQRIENEAAASRRSIRALADALDVAVEDLQGGDPAPTGRSRIEYRIVEIEPENGFFADARPAGSAGLAARLNAEGEAGWRLVQILSPEESQRLRAGRTGRFAALMQRECRVGPADTADAEPAKGDAARSG